MNSQRHTNRQKRRAERKRYLAAGLAGLLAFAMIFGIMAQFFIK